MMFYVLSQRTVCTVPKNTVRTVCTVPKSVKSRANQAQKYDRLQ